MKKRFITFAMKIVRSYYPHYTTEKCAEIQYGLESFYLTFTKMVIIFTLSLWLGNFKEMLLLLLCFNIFRTTAFGLHATKSWICLTFSSLVFLGIPWVMNQFVLPLLVKILFGMGAVILFYLYAPADTKKRPILKKAKRERYRWITVSTCLILTIFSFFITNQIVVNAIYCGMYIEIILILPITYKIFNLPYANYKNYVKSVSLN